MICVPHITEVFISELKKEKKVWKTWKIGNIQRVTAFGVLVKIKNGRIVANKYNSPELKFQTPNIVIVFSNDKPEVKNLSKDRWKIFRIQNEDLLDVTKMLVK